MLASTRVGVTAESNTRQPVRLSVWTLLPASVVLQSMATNRDACTPMLFYRNASTRLVKDGNLFLHVQSGSRHIQTRMVLPRGKMLFLASNACLLCLCVRCLLILKQCGYFPFARMQSQREALIQNRISLKDVA